MILKHNFIKIIECFWMPFTRWVKAMLADVKDLTHSTQQTIGRARFELSALLSLHMLPTAALCKL